jgi:TRAP-type C4-dicarboxylate transport system permease small subunit
MDLPMTIFGVAIPLAFTLIVLHVLADLAVALSETRKTK